MVFGIGRMAARQSRIGLRSAAQLQTRRGMGGGGGHGEPHVPEGYDLLGKTMLVSCYLWIFWRVKEDKGQIFVSFHFIL
jgi:hypothetical protein